MLNWTKIDSDGSLSARGKNAYYLILVRGVPEQRPKDCIIELYSSSRKIKISEVKYKTNNPKVELLSRLVVIGDLSSETSIVKDVEKMKDAALKRENKNPYGSINSAYTTR